MSETYSQVWRSKDCVNWEKVNETPPYKKRRGAGVAVFNGKLWVLGGEDGNGADYGDVWNSSDGVTWTQVTAAAPWGKRNNFTPLVFNDKLWIVSGDGAVSSKVVWSTSDGEKWTLVTDKAPWSGRYWNRTVVFDNRLWFMGGNANGGNPQNDVWYSSDGEKWTQAANAAWSARANFSTVTYDRKLWVISGFSGDYVKDVWYTESQTGVDGQLFRIAEPAPPIKSIGPNPFRDNVQIRFLTSQTSPATIRIFNGAGREIATIWAGPGSGGERAVTWNGLTSSGAGAPDGTYFAQCEAGGSTATRTIVKNGGVR